MVQDSLCELVIFVHPLGDCLPRVVGAPFDSRAMEDPIDQHALRYI